MLIMNAACTKWLRQLLRFVSFVLSSMLMYAYAFPPAVSISNQSINHHNIHINQPGHCHAIGVTVRQPAYGYGKS